MNVVDRIVFGVGTIVWMAATILLAVHAGGAEAAGFGLGGAVAMLWYATKCMESE